MNVSVYIYIYVCENMCRDCHGGSHSENNCLTSKRKERIVHKSCHASGQILIVPCDPHCNLHPATNNAILSAKSHTKLRFGRNPKHETREQKIKQE